MTWTAEHNERQRQRPVVRLPRDDDLLDEQEREGLLVHMPPHPRPEECCSSTRSDRGASLTAWKQLVEIFQIAVPTALGNLSEFLPITFAMSMVGRLNVGGDGLQLDALAMANSYWNMTGLAVQYGLNSAMRTLAPHAVGSGRSRELSGIHAQRAALIAVVALVPSVVLGSYADRILMLAGQPPDLALLAREYVLLVQPALAGIALMTILQRVLQAEGHILANFYISFAVFLAAPVVQYALIDRMGWGLHGAGIAFSIYNCLYLLLMVPYMIWADLGHVFVLRREALSAAGLYAHLSLAVPGLCCQLLEWASMELVSIIAGTRRSAQQLIGAIGLCLNLEAILCMFAVGFMVAVSIKVGHAIGSGDSQLAKRVACLGVVAASSFAILISAALYVLRSVVVHAYTADPSIASTAKNLFGPLCLLVTLQAVNCTTQGVLTGAGLQRFTALCNLVGWYLVAAPLVYGLIWGLDLDLESGPVLLLSCSLAMLTSVIGQTVVLARQDWDVIIAESLQRLHAEQAAWADPLQAAEADEAMSGKSSSRNSLARTPTASGGVIAMWPGGEQRPRALSLAHSMVSGYSIVSDYSTVPLGSSPFALVPPHPHSNHFVVPRVPSLASQGEHDRGVPAE